MTKQIKFPALMALSLAVGCIDTEDGSDQTLDESAVVEGDDDVGAGPTTLQACNPTIPSSYLGITSRWTVKVRTADVDYAGTDARISFRVTYRLPDGTLDYTNAIRIDKGGYDNFERNQVDTFEVPIVNYGTPVAIQLYSDYTGNNAAWYPTKVSITDYKSGRSWSGFFQGWIYTYSPDTPLACGS